MIINTLNLIFRQFWSLQLTKGKLLVRYCGDKFPVRKIRTNCRAVITNDILYLDALYSVWSASGAQIITVEPQVQYNVSGQDDLKLIRQYSREASWEWSISNETWNLLKPLGVSKARLINVESENTLSIDPKTKDLHLTFQIAFWPGYKTARPMDLFLIL